MENKIILKINSDSLPVIICPEWEETKNRLEQARQEVREAVRTFNSDADVRDSRIKDQRDRMQKELITQEAKRDKLMQMLTEALSRDDEAAADRIKRAITAQTAGIEAQKATLSSVTVAVYSAELYQRAEDAHRRFFQALDDFEKVRIKVHDRVTVILNEMNRLSDETVFNDRFFPGATEERIMMEAESRLKHKTSRPGAMM